MKGNLLFYISWALVVQLTFCIFSSDSHTSPAKETFRILNVGDPSRFLSHPQDILLNPDLPLIKSRLLAILNTTSSNLTELLPLLNSELRLSTTNLSASWAEATKTYEFRNVTLPPFPRIYHLPLMAFTLDSPAPVYKDFGKRTRAVKTPGDILDYPYKSYFRLLKITIEVLGSVDKYKGGVATLYRGLMGGSMGYKVGDKVMFQHYLSTSKSLTVAQVFAFGGTVLELRGNLTDCVYVKHHSRFPGEEEVILSPFYAWVVLKVEEREWGHANYTHVTLQQYPY